MVYPFTRSVQQHTRWNPLHLRLPYEALVTSSLVHRCITHDVVATTIVPVCLNHVPQRGGFLHGCSDEDGSGEGGGAVLEEPAKMVVALDRFFAGTKGGIAVVPAKDAVASAVVALLADAEPIAEVGVLVGAVDVA